jgi:hypothetical protein
MCSALDRRFEAQFKDFERMHQNRSSAAPERMAGFGWGDPEGRVDLDAEDCSAFLQSFVAGNTATAAGVRPTEGSFSLDGQRFLRQLERAMHAGLPEAPGLGRGDPRHADSMPKRQSISGEFDRAARDGGADCGDVGVDLLGRLMQDMGGRELHRTQHGQMHSWDGSRESEGSTLSDGASMFGGSSMLIGEHDASGDEGAASSSEACGHDPAFAEAYNEALQNELSQHKLDCGPEKDGLVDVDMGAVHDLLRSVTAEAGDPGAASVLMAASGMRVPKNLQLELQE